MRRTCAAIFALLFCLGLATSLVVTNNKANASRGFDPSWEASCRGLNTKTCFTTKLWAPSHREAWGPVATQIAQYKYYSERLTAEIKVRVAQSPLRAFPPGTFQSRAPLDAAGGGGGYTGLGDIVSGAVAYWSCTRAYNAAFAATQGSICDLVDTTTGVATCTLKIGTNGLADLTSLSCVGGTLSVTTFCTVTHTGCSIAKKYDQTGNSHDMTTVALGNDPALTLNGLGTCPVATFNGTTNIMKATGFAVAQAFSIAAIAKTTTSGAVQALLTDSTGAQFMLSATPKLRIQTNTVLDSTGTLTNNTWYSLQAVANNTSSVSTLNGADTSGTSGSNGITAGHTLSIGSDDFTEVFTGSMAEEGVWPSGFTSGNRTSISANQRAICGSF